MFFGKSSTIWRNCQLHFFIFYLLYSKNKTRIQSGETCDGKIATLYIFFYNLARKWMKKETLFVIFSIIFSAQKKMNSVLLYLISAYKSNCYRKKFANLNFFLFISLKKNWNLWTKQIQNVHIKSKKKNRHAI